MQSHISEKAKTCNFEEPKIEKKLKCGFFIRLVAKKKSDKALPDKIFFASCRFDNVLFGKVFVATGV
jgi:hypothetical protein